MERVVLSSGDMIRREQLPEDLLEIDIPQTNPLSYFHRAVKVTKRELILKAIKQASGKYTEAAKTLGLHPNYLHRLIRNLNLKPSVREQTSFR